MKDILEKIKNSNIRIAVIGDSMLDEYFDVSVRKISPEFPIPVMHSDNEDPTNVFPGGAANVAFQLKNFNKNTFLCSFLDANAKSILSKHGLDTSLSIDIPNNISRKKRFYSNEFPTYRWDVEKSNCGLSESEITKYCCDLFDRIMEQEFDVIIFSDYDKGVFYNNIVSNLAKTHKCQIKIVDPKTDIYKWLGCSLIKPNSIEAKNITGQSDHNKQIEKIINITNAKNVIITNGGDGLYGYDGDYFDYKCEEILDAPNSVIGAGDCFIAFCGLCLGNEISLRDASKFSFKMGSIYVKEKHNKPLDFNKINSILNKVESKYVTPEFFENRNFKLCMTNGCFDILHSGHISNLNYAKSFGDKLLVAVNADESVSKLKPNRPINKLEDRMLLLANLQCVDYVLYFDEDTPYEIIKKIKPDFLVKGMEYQNSNVIGREFAKNTIFAPMVENISTTKIINRINI